MDDPKPIAQDVADGLSTAARQVMARQPDVEAVCFVVLSEALNDSGQLVGVLVGANGTDTIRPDQYLRMISNLCKAGAALFTPVRQFDAALHELLESQARTINERARSTVGASPVPSPPPSAGESTPLSQDAGHDNTEP